MLYLKSYQGILFIVTSLFFSATIFSQKYVPFESKEDLILKAQSGVDTAITILVSNYKLEDFTSAKDKEFFANMNLLHLRTHYIMRGQYFDLLNGFWGGQSGGFVESIKKVPLCKKKIDILAHIPYKFTSNASDYIVDHLVKEQEYAIKVQELRSSVKSNTFNTATSYITTPDWIYPNRNDTEEDVKRANENNSLVVEKRAESLTGYFKVISSAMAASELNDYYNQFQFKFLENLKEHFSSELAKTYKEEYTKHCNYDYTDNIYEYWFQKEYLEFSDTKFSEYKFDDYFDSKRTIDAYRLWIDSNYKNQENIIPRVINSGQYYALKLALKRGLSPDTKNDNGISGRQALVKEGHGYVQSQMTQLIRDYDSDPTNFIKGVPKKDISEIAAENNTKEPSFDDPSNNVTSLKILLAKDGPQVLKGQEVYIRASGNVFLGGFAGNSGPEGINGFKNYNFEPHFNHGALLYRISNSGKWSVIQKKTSFIAQNSGVLQMVVNDKGYQNNSGGYNVEILVKEGSSNNINEDANSLELEDKDTLIKTNYRTYTASESGKLASEHSTNFKGLGIIYYSSGPDEKITKTMKQLHSFFTSREINNPKVFYTEYKEQNKPDVLSIYVNGKNVLNKANNNAFIKQIEQIMTYHKNGQFVNSKN